MSPYLLALILGLQDPAPAPQSSPQPAPMAKPQAAPEAKPGPKPPPAAKSVQALKPLGFHSQRFPYYWDRLIPINVEVDGLKINSIFFNRREIRSGPLKGADFGTRAQVEVTNAAKRPRMPGFAVAVFDADNNLLGVASGGVKIGTVKPGNTETFDLNFHQVLERLPKGTTFILSLELSE